MRILSFEAEGLFSFKEPLHLEPLGQLSTFIGPNNSGKTNVFRILSGIFVETIMEVARTRRHEDTLWAADETYYYPGKDLLDSR